MKKLLVVVDMQRDFIDGALGTKEAVAIVPNVVEKIRNWDGDVVATRDTHFADYLSTREGRHLPVPHCLINTDGWKINDEVAAALEELPANRFIGVINKFSFGSQKVADLCKDYDYVLFIGLCTDICVVSNALMAKNTSPEIDIAVDPACCAGVTPESHEAALTTMKFCQIEMV